MQRVFNKLIVFTVVLVMILMSPFMLQSRQDEVLNSMGDYTEQCFYTHGEFQDYTDFAIYACSSAELNGHPIFSPVSEENRETMDSFIDDFEEWVSVIGNNDPADELAVNYSFDRSIIDSLDYYYIYENKDYPKFGCYDVWFFDSQTNLLYYFHSNI